MYEDNAIRALIIGVSLFVFILTMSAIILYYNAAVDTANILNNEKSYKELYKYDVEYLKTNSIELDGADVKNIIRKQVDDNITLDVSIKIDSTEFNGAALLDNKGNVLESVINEIKYDKKYRITELQKTDSSLKVKFEKI